MADLNELLFAVIAGATFSYMLTAFSRRWPKLEGKDRREMYLDDVLDFLEIPFIGHKKGHLVLGLTGASAAFLIAFFGYIVLNCLPKTNSFLKIFITIYVIALAVVPYAVIRLVGCILWRTAYKRGLLSPSAKLSYQDDLTWGKRVNGDGRFVVYYFGVLIILPVFIKILALFNLWLDFTSS